VLPELDGRRAEVDFGVDSCFFLGASKRSEMSEVGTVFLGDTIEASEVNAKVEASHFFLNEKNRSPWEEREADEPVAGSHQ